MSLTDLPKDYIRNALKFTRTVYQDVYPSIDPTTPELSLAGKVVVVTGASRGIGAKAFVPAFAKAGVKGLVLIARSGEKLKEVEAQVKEIDSTIEVLCIPTDIVDSKAVEKAFEKTKEKLGHADILVNNAGINADGGGALIGDQDPDTWWSNYDVNVKGTFLMNRSFILQLPNTDIAATIINVTTAGAWSVVPPQSGYCLSKLGTLQQIPFVAQGYPNITAIALHPGLLDTDMLPPAFRHFDLETPELVGGIGVWLSHPHAKFLSGRFIASQWSVDELLERREEISSGRQLMVTVTGPFGPKQFE
jgi:NAD(P)-dependent dehydrogenase (short-subunit alcohol dehydrogenase family)